MNGYPRSEVERAMKIQEVIMKVFNGQLLWMEAAEILGVSCRTMRRWKRRYEIMGYDGLFDRRRQSPSPRRVPLDTVREVLRLYREEYPDFNVAHFHEKLVNKHGIQLSYEWVKKALQTAGLVSVGRRRKGVHRKKRERRPIRGMMLFCDGSTHEWIPLLPGLKQDLIVLMDDATSEVYSAYLVDEEGTATVMAGLREVIEKVGIFCCLYTDRGGHFFHTPKAGGPVDKSRPTQIGRALAQLGIESLPSYSPQARGRMERLFGTWQGRLPQELRQAGVTSMAEANRYIREVFMPWHNQHLTVPAREPGTAFVAAGNADLDAILSIQHERIVQNDNTVTLGKLTLQVAPAQWKVSFAKSRVTVCQHLDGSLSIRLGPRILGWYNSQGNPLPGKPEKMQVA